MFCPRCGQQQVSQDTRFCSRCGLSLDLLADLLSDDGERLRRERRELTGIGLTLATVMMLLNFIIIFGAVTLPHLANPVFLWIWVSFVVSSLVVGGFALANLVRGGFFKRLKEREARLRLSQAEWERRVLPEAATSAGGAEALPPFKEPANVTEATTRELEVVPRSEQAKVRLKQFGS